MATHDNLLRRKILDALQKDGRITNHELAERAGSSPSPVWRRVKEMEEEGIIRRYVALLDPEKVGVGECVFAQINIERHKPGMYETFEEMVMQRPEVLECYAVTGDCDFMLKIRVPSVRAYDRLLNECIFRIPGVTHIKSSFALRQIKYDTALPLGADLKAASSTELAIEEADG